MKCPGSFKDSLGGCQICHTISLCKHSVDQKCSTVFNQLKGTSDHFQYLNAAERSQCWYKHLSSTACGRQLTYSSPSSCVEKGGHPVPSPTPGLFSAQGYVRLEVRLSESLLLLSVCQKNIFAAELKYNCSLHWRTNAVESVEQGLNAGSFPSPVSTVTVGPSCVLAVMNLSLLHFE